MMYNAKHEEMKAEAREDIIDALERGYSGYYCDLHHEVFNTDFYIVGTEMAKDALREYDVFEAIELVQDYERNVLGAIYTDLSNPERIINMIYYIIGEEVINEMLHKSEAFSERWNDYADDETNEAILMDIK